MAKNTIRTYSTTAASNTDVGGVDVQGTAPASNMDDGLREIMSHLAETNAGTAPLDDTFSLCDPADATKKFRFDGGNVSAGQTRVFTVPDADMVLGNIPNANDGAALGSATKSWSDLFLASGGVFNFNNGNYTVTHSSGILTFSGVIAAASTIEVGHATDTTISRGAAGFIAVEGNRVPSPASQAAGDILYRDTNEWARLAKGTAGQTLRMNSGATAPEWAGSGAPDAVLEDQKAAGTDGGTFTSGAWRTRDLNTEVKDTYSLISISSNQFTPTVNGWVEWSAPALKVELHKTRLFNVTDTTVAGVGSTEKNASGENAQTQSTGSAPVVAGKVYRIEHQCSNTNADDGFGIASGFSTTEVYTRVLFWRTA